MTTILEWRKKLWWRWIIVDDKPVALVLVQPQLPAPAL